MNEWLWERSILPQIFQAQTFKITLGGDVWRNLKLSNYIFKGTLGCLSKNIHQAVVNLRLKSQKLVWAEMIDLRIIHTRITVKAGWLGESLRNQATGRAKHRKGEGKGEREILSDGHVAACPKETNPACTQCTGALASPHCTGIN